MGKKQANIKTDIKLFFKYWLNFTKPFHSLSDREINVVSLLLYYHHIFKKETTNEKMLWKMLFDYDTKMLIKKELDNMKDPILQNILSSLRRKKVIVNNKLNQAYIPDIGKDNNFKIIFNFLINAEKNQNKS